jgi:16S rRNA (guanine(966)-N(2))-methyltransferase RsmD
MERRKLPAIKDKTRPTSAKVIAALLSILRSANLDGADFLDLFAGTGAVAAAALERGAAAVLCVESDAVLAGAISARFAASGLAPPRAVCVRADARRAIPRIARDGRSFGVVFADPPYNLGWARELPELIARNWGVVSDGGVFVLERSSRETPAEIFVPRDDRIYGDTVLSFYWKNST